jgi:excisionase family DNA binding protein
MGEVMKQRHRGRKAEPKPGDAVNEIMTLHEVADYLQLHPISVYRFIKTGSLPGFRLGSDWRFRRSDLAKWIEQHHVRHEEPKANEPTRHKRKDTDG